MSSSTEQGGERGRDADKPSEIDAKGWRDIALRVKDEAKTDNVPLLGAGVAFYAFLSLFPGLVALVSLYGLVADRAQVERQIEDFASALPAEIKTILTQQLTSLAEGQNSALGLGLLLSVLAALFSASSGMNGFIKATNLAYDEEETRGFLKLRAIALALTVGGVLLFLVALGLIAVVPAALANVPGLGPIAEGAIRVLRWPLLAVLVAAALATVYRYAPDRDAPKFSWVSWGAGIATLLWLVASGLFSLYVSNFGNYTASYGAIGGVMVLLLWLFITGAIALLGAEINAEMEAQTARDTTQGADRPLGTRTAVKADTVAPSPPSRKRTGGRKPTGSRRR